MKLAPTPPLFTIGQTVIFINHYGVNWGPKTITNHKWDDIRGHTYQYKDTDTPWFFTSERHLIDPNDTTTIKERTRVTAHH